MCSGRGTHFLCVKNGDAVFSPCALFPAVPGHQNFEEVPYGKQLKINLILNSSLVHLYYTPKDDPTEHLLLDKGEFTKASIQYNTKWHFFTSRIN